MNPGKGFSDHIRSNVVGYVALFFVMAGGAYALPGTNTVDSGDIQNGQVRSPDIGTGQVGAPDLANSSVNSAKVANNSITGSDVLESKLTRVPSATNADKLDHFNSSDFLGANAQAGGDLGGPLSNLQIADNAVGSSEVADNAVGSSEIADNAVGSSEVADNSLTGNDVDESSLSGLVSGTGRVLTGSLTVTSNAGNPTILALPGWGVVRVAFCTPNATASNRSASAQFFSSGPSGTVWTISSVSANSSQTDFSTSHFPFLGGFVIGQANANEGLSVMLSRTDTGELVSLQIGELTGDTSCDFHVQAVMSG